MCGGGECLEGSANNGVVSDKVATATDVGVNAEAVESSGEDHFNSIVE